MYSASLLLLTLAAAPLGCCHAGYAFDGARCVACPNGAQCDGFGVQLDYLPLHRGRWRTSRASTVLERCPLRGACRPPEDPNATTSGDDLCDPTTEGPLCAVCRAGYYESGAARACERCGGGEIVLYVLPTICVLFFIAIVFSLKAAKVAARSLGVSSQAHQRGGQHRGKVQTFAKGAAARAPVR